MGLDCYWETESGEPGVVDLPEEFALAGGWFSDGTGSYFRGNFYRKFVFDKTGFDLCPSPHREYLSNDEIRSIAQSLDTALAVIDVDESYYCDFDGYDDEEEFELLARLVRVFRAHSDAGHVLRLSY